VKFEYEVNSETSIGFTFFGRSSSGSVSVIARIAGYDHVYVIFRNSPQSSNSPSSSISESLRSSRGLTSEMVNTALPL
jgi:hypothetical protein